MKAVIDTNVVISAVLRDRDPETVIRFITHDPTWEWIASPDTVCSVRQFKQLVIDVAP